MRKVRLCKAPKHFFIKTVITDAISALVSIHFMVVDDCSLVDRSAPYYIDEMAHFDCDS